MFLLVEFFFFFKPARCSQSSYLDPCAFLKSPCFAGGIDAVENLETVVDDAFPGDAENHRIVAGVDGFHAEPFGAIGLKSWSEESQCRDDESLQRWVSTSRIWSQLAKDKSQRSLSCSLSTPHSPVKRSY